MTKAKNIFLVLDSETCDLAGNVYDVGFTITDKKGKIYASYNALVEEIFTDGKKMMGAFYAKKLFSHYAPMLQAGLIELTPWKKIVEEIQAACVKHSVTCVAAYNLGFDRRVMAQTNKLLGIGKVMPYAMKQLDIWQFACETKLNTVTYKKLAAQMGWISKAGNIRSGAEYAYRFCSGDWGFIEDHTALSDAIIETKILADCFAMKKKIPYDVVNGMPWSLIQGKK